MRMWMTDVQWMCDNCLIKEHDDIHSIENKLNNGVGVENEINLGNIDVSQLERRHKDLVRELSFRGVLQNTPLKGINNKPDRTGYVDKNKSKQALLLSCPLCWEKYIALKRDGKVKE